MSTPPVVVAVVSYNTRELLAACLDSLAPEVESGRAAVWVVDNASTDGSVELVRERAPWAELVASSENLGFGPAVNLVAERTESPWIAPANADIALLPGALETLLHAAGDDPRCGVAAPQLVLTDGRTQHSVYRFPTVPFTLAFNLGLHRLSRRLADRLLLEGYWNPSRPRPVDWAIGAFLLVRRAAFSEVGGFDDEHWMYAEDLDLGWRLHRAGWSTRYEPEARVRHAESAATSVAFGDAKVARFMAASYRTLLARRGLVRTWATAGINCTGAAARLVVFAALARVSERWLEPRDLNRMWLRAHRQGLASRRALEGYR